MYQTIKLKSMILVWSAIRQKCRNGKFVQFLCAIIAALGMMCAGLQMGWSTPVLPKLFRGEAGFEISRSEASWIVSMLTFGAGFGSILAKFLVDRIGRKMTIFLSSGPYALSWLLIMFSTSGSYLFAAQLIAGISLGTNLVVISMYLGEIAENHLRGALSSTLNFGLNVGCLISYSIGQHFNYRQVTYISIAFPIFFFLTSFWLPESPYYYIIKGEKEKAAKSLAILRNSNDKEVIYKELDLIDSSIKLDHERRGDLKELLTNKAYRKALIVAFGLRAFQQLTGCMAVSAYLQVILEDSHMSMSPGHATIIYGVAQIVAGVLATLLTDRLGRKILLFISFSTLGIIMTIMGGYFFIQDHLKYPREIMTKFSWIPMVCTVSYSLSFNVGIGSLGYVMLSELFPTNVKSIGVCIGSAFGAFLTFMVTKLYLVIADSLGMYVAFWIFAAFSFTGFVFTYFLVPETKNKSFKEIQDKLNRVKPKKTYFEVDSRVVLVAIIKT